MIETLFAATSDGFQKLQQLRIKIQPETSERAYSTSSELLSNVLGPALQVLDSSCFVLSDLAKYHPPFSPVPPREHIEIQGREWYEHGILREWHERRRRGLITDVSPEIHQYERVNGLVPSYESQRDNKETARLPQVRLRLLPPAHH